MRTSGSLYHTNLRTTDLIHLAAILVLNASWVGEPSGEHSFERGENVSNTETLPVMRVRENDWNTRDVPRNEG